MNPKKDTKTPATQRDSSKVKSSSTTSKDVKQTLAASKPSAKLVPINPKEYGTANKSKIPDDKITSASAKKSVEYKTNNEGETASKLKRAGLPIPTTQYGTSNTSGVWNQTITSLNKDKEKEKEKEKEITPSAIFNSISNYENPGTQIVIGNYDTIGDKEIKLEVNLLNSGSKSNIDENEPKNLLSQKEFELGQMKKVIAEKKELQDLLTAVRKEKDEYRKKLVEQDDLINICMKELEESTKQIEVLNLDKINSDNKYSELESQMEQSKKDYEELKKKLEETELDLLIKIEEYEEKTLELEKANAMLKDTKNFRSEASRVIENLQESSPELKKFPSEMMTQDDALIKIAELEDQVTKLATAVYKISEERNYEVTYLQNEIEKLNKKLSDNAILLEESSKKDVTIKNLNTKMSDSQSLVDELKEQLAVFSQASTMMDNLIYEKNEMENQLMKIKEERDNFKNELNTNDLLIEEYETAIKISNDIIREKENAVLQINITLNAYKQTIEEFENKEKNLLNVINDLKTQNKIIREEISKIKNVNVDEILNKNVNTNSRLKTLERKKVLKILSDIEMAKLQMRNIIFNSMIPKKIFDLGSIESFDKFLQVRTLRKKTLNLIFNIIENDLIEKSKDIVDDSLAMTNKTFITFIKNVLQTLIDFNILLLTVEIIFSQYKSDQFKSIHSNKNFITLWTNISAASQFIENLILQIKDDNFSVKYQYEGLKSIVKTLKEDVNTGKIELEIKDLDTNYPIVTYENELMNQTIFMLLNYKEDLIKIHKDKSLVISLEKILIAAFKKVKSTLKQIDNKFFLEINYENSKNIFEMDNSYFKKLIESGKELMGSTPTQNNSEEIFARYDLISDNLSKTCVVITSFIEKYEKELGILSNNRITPDNNSSLLNLSILPGKGWNDITLEVFNELDAGIKIKEALEANEAELNHIKFEKVNLESKIEEMSRAKKINDQKLAEALVAAGKLAQIESEVEEKNKKIEKYNTTVEALIKNIEMEQEKNKELKAKLDLAGSTNFSRSSGQSQQQQQQNEGRSSGVKRAAFIGNSMTSNSQNMGLSINNTFIADSIPLLNTIYQLQRERKLLKTKITKEKVEQLLYDQNSYINRFINKNSKSEEDLYNQIEDPVSNINENFKKVRRDLCLSKVYDITQENYNYEKTKKVEENQIKQLRIKYMQDVDKIFNNMFADHSLDGSFKNFIDKDIKRYLYKLYFHL